MVMATYDPLGLASPALVRGKLLLRRLYGPSATKGWDDDLPLEEKTLWAKWFETLILPVEAVFPRSTRPPNAMGLPRLAGFGDASMLALCAVLYVIWTDDKGINHPRILTGKCRVSPLHGTTVPRGELQALLVLHRLAVTVCEAFPYKFASVTMFTDSLCSVGAMSRPPSALRPYFGNRVMEVVRIREQLVELTNELSPISHIPGSLNPADLGTRGLVGVGDLGPGSTWQTGPSFLRDEYETWPSATSGEEAVRHLPQEECRVLHALQAGEEDSGEELHRLDVSCPATVREDVKLAGGRGSPFTSLLQGVSGGSQLGETIQAMATYALRREKLELAVRSLARVLRAVVAGDREKCNGEPSVKMVEIAVRVLLRCAAHSAKTALDAGKLQGLGAEERGGVVWITGRVRGEQLATLLGTSALPVVLPTEPLAVALLQKSHREDHRRGPRDAAARSRRAVWIVSATKLAKKIIAGCYNCRYRDRKMGEQLMGTLPPERLEITAPFEATSLDLFGPFWVKDPAKGRRRFKCWIVAYVCMGSKAVCLLPCPGYSTDVFLSTHKFFTGLYGKPKIVYTDHAPSLIKAAETPDWEEIGGMVGAQGTEWRLTAKGCSWRNGLAERVIRSARHTLSHELRVGETLDYHQFGAVLITVASILNHRPLSLRVSPEGEYHALAPRDVLFGRASRSVDEASRALQFTMDLEQDQALRNMCDDQARIVHAWKRKWMDTVFPDLVARPKWRVACRNLRPGDLGHVKYTRAVGQQEWRLAMVEKASPDQDGIVRTVTVAFRPRNKRDVGKPYVTKDAQRMEIGVQRFAVLMAVEEMDKMAQKDEAAPLASETTLN